MECGPRGDGRREGRGADGRRFWWAEELNPLESYGATLWARLKLPCAISSASPFTFPHHLRRPCGRLDPQARLSTSPRRPHLLQAKHAHPDMAALSDFAARCLRSPQWDLVAALGPTDTAFSSLAGALPLRVRGCLRM